MIQFISKGFLIVTLFLCLFTGLAMGSGFAVYTQGNNPLGQGLSTVAHGNDASVIFFNPALLTSFDKSQIEIGTTLLLPSTTMKSNLTGKEYHMKREVFAPSFLFTSYRVNDNVTAGLGAFSHFGLSSKWDSSWEGRYIATESNIKTYTVNPVVAVKITPGLSIAGGVDILFIAADLQKKLNLAPLGLPFDTNQRLKGDDTGIGFNLGIAVDISKDISFGASYRSKINTTLKGKVEHSFPAGSPPILSSLFPETHASAALSLPAQAFAGVAYKGIDKLTIEVGGRWEGWSSFSEFKVNLAKPVAGSVEAITPKNWNDVYAFNLGARYQLSDNIALNAGYVYEGNPVPNSTLDPTLPISNAHIFTAGTDIRFKNISIGLVYAYQKNVSRTKNNVIDDNPSDGVFNPINSANGKYKTHFQEIGIALTYRF